MQGNYVTDLLPFILLMSFGMGMTFVPLTLTAVHHLRNEDTGIGSGVLNTMQQVGGALGLSLLGTVATQTIDDRVGVLQSAAREGRCRRRSSPLRRHSSRRPRSSARTRSSPRARPLRSSWPRA